MPYMSRKKIVHVFPFVVQTPSDLFFWRHLEDCMCMHDKQTEFLSDSDLVALSKDDEVSDTVNR